MAGNWEPLSPLAHQYFPPILKDPEAEDLQKFGAVEVVSGDEGHTHDGTGTASTVLGGENEAGDTAPTASGNNSIAIGDYAQATATQSTAIGSGTSSTLNAEATGLGAVALGADASVTGEAAIGIGTGVTATGKHAISIGSGTSQAPGEDTIVMGFAQGATNFASIAIGRNGGCIGFDSAIAIGNATRADAERAIALGTSADATGTRAIAIGSASGADTTSADASGQDSIAIGVETDATQTDATALGRAAQAIHATSTALGKGATTTKANQVILGTSAEVVTHPGGVEYRVNPKSVNYTATRQDFYIPGTGGAGGITITLPAATGTGQVLIVKKVDSGAGAVTVARTGADLIDGATSVALSARFDAVILQDRAAGLWDVLTDPPGSIMNHGTLGGLSDDDHTQYILHEGNILASASSILMDGSVTGDTFDRFSIAADGRIQWGPGNAALDVNLYRSAADTLKTDDAIAIAGANPASSTAEGRLSALQVRFKQSAGDEASAGTIDYRGFSGGSLSIVGAGTSGSNRKTRMFDFLSVGFDSKGLSAIECTTLGMAASGDTETKLALVGDVATPSIEFGSGAAARDTNLYREAANILATDDKLHVVGELEVDGALNHDGSTMGFYGTAPATQQTVTGSRGGNAALASLLTALAASGIIVDSTTA